MTKRNSVVETQPVEESPINIAGLINPVIRLDEHLLRRVLADYISREIPEGFRVDAGNIIFKYDYDKYNEESRFSHIEIPLKLTEKNEQ